MRLSLELLVGEKILVPLADTQMWAGAEINSVAVFEASGYFLQSLREKTLIFFPCGTIISKEQLCKMNREGCVMAFHQQDVPPIEKTDGLNIFLIHEGVTLSQAVEFYYETLCNNVKKLAEESLEVMDKLSNELLSHEYKDTNIINMLHEILGVPVTFTTADFNLQKVKSIPKECLVFNPLYTEDLFNWDLVLEDFSLNDAQPRANLAIGISGAGIRGYTYQNEYCRKLKCRIFIFSITDEADCYGYILMSVDEGLEFLPQSTGVKIQQVLAALKFEVIKSEQIAHTINRYYDFLLDELIESDKTDFRKLMQKYGLVQKVVADEYYVLIVGRKPRSEAVTIFHNLLTSQQFNLLYDWIVDVLGTINFFIFERKDSVVVLLSKKLVEEIPEAFLKVISVFRRFPENEYEGAGISDEVATENVRQGYFQATKALAISQHSHDKAPCFYSNLGVLRFFFDRSNQVDPAPLMLIYEEYILPVIKYDESRSSQLFSTLTMYMSCCSSPSSTCAALFIHKNTLYSRLNKIATVLNKDLSDSEVLFNISLGIRIHALILAGML